MTLKELSESIESVDCDRDYVLSHIMVRLINKERNEVLLKGIPNRNFLDLAKIYVFQPVPEHKWCTITNGILDDLGITENELDEVARHNTELAGFEVSKLSDMLGEVPDDKEDLYVVTNEKVFYGAAAMLFGNAFKSLANTLGKDLYVLPSSVHEVIVVPADMASVEEMRNLVRSVNTNEVDANNPQDKLSDNVYVYRREKGKVEIA